MPALVSKRLGSSGISDEEGMRLQPFSSKNFKYFSRISAVVMYFIGQVSLSYFGLAGPRPDHFQLAHDSQRARPRHARPRYVARIL